MKSIAVIDQISKLSEAGHPIKKIAVILGVSRNTVRRYLREEIVAKNTNGARPVLTRELDWKNKLDWDWSATKDAKATPQSTFTRSLGRRLATPGSVII